MKKTLFLLLALPGMVQAEKANGFIFASSASGSGDVSMIVNDGQSGDAWSAAFGVSANNDDNTLTHTGNITMTYEEDYAGTGTGTATGYGTTAFGVVNVGKVTGNVGLTFSAADATYGTFTGTNAASVAGGFKGSIGGTFTATINAGTFNKDIIGGLHSAGEGDSIGATTIVINGGTIKGNVYGGGFAGTIVGDTSVSITNLGAFATHGTDNIISAGDKNAATTNTIGGDSVVTFTGVDGSYAGTVSGGHNVAGTSTLKVYGNSTLTLNNVSNFDTFVLEEGSTLTVNGAITTDAIFSVAYDATTATTKTENGLGAGAFSGLVSGEGSFYLGANATINGKTVNGTNGKDFFVDNAVYYVVNSTVLDAPESPTAPREEGAVYSLGNGKEILESSVVYVGTHNYSAPKATEGANEALGYYVGKNSDGTRVGTLCIMADVNPTKTAGQILQSVQGDGNIILRTAGYENPDGSLPMMHVYVDGKTQVTGELYLAPYYVGASEGSMKFQPGVVLELQEGADISSFKAVYMCYPESAIALNGTLGRSSEKVGHINNLQAYGSSYTYLYVNKNTNDTIVLGGDTVLQSYEHGAGTLAGGHLRIVANKNNSTINIEHLEGEDANSSLAFQSAMEDIYEKDSEVNSTLNIESFDFHGSIEIWGSGKIGGSLHINVNLLDGQRITSNQYSTPFGHVAKQKPSLTLTGIGTYELIETNDILINIGRLSTEMDEAGERLWKGTVQMTNVDTTATGTGTAAGHGIDFSFYGNESSKVDMHGVKADVVAWDADRSKLETQPDSVDVVTNLHLTNYDTETGTMSAFEIAGGIATQNYKGKITGTGDIVISAADTKNINVEGIINEWTGNISATNGTHNVCLANDEEAVTVNGTISNANDDSAINLTVDTAKGTTFKKEIDVDSLTVNSGAAAVVTTISHAGNVQISQRGAAPTTISDGMSISTGSISGGKAENATLAFDSAEDNTVSSATLHTVAITSVAGSSVMLDDVSATDVYLMGNNVNFQAVVDGTKFTVIEAADGGGSRFNEVSFETYVLSGMTLADDGASVTLDVSNDLDWVKFSANNAKSNVTIKLHGFTLEGVPGSGKGWPSDNLMFNTGLSSLAADGTYVADLLNLDLQKYASVNYQQTGNGLIIRMQHAIPEPTTATLSLLALAALAARRRRK